MKASLTTTHVLLKYPQGDQHIVNKKLKHLSFFLYFFSFFLSIFLSFYPCLDLDISLLIKQTESSRKVYAHILTN